MKRIVVVLLLLFCVVSISLSQEPLEHAPTAAQCQADRAVWIKDFSTGNIKNVPVTTLNGRAMEMGSCMDVDANHAFDYYTVQASSLIETENRQSRFLSRHNLYLQFVEEDAAGKR